MTKDKEKELLDLHTLKTSSQTAVSKNWKKYHNDIVFECKTQDKKDAYIYLLIEHQSTPDPLMPIRLLRYKLNILGKYLDTKTKAQKLPNILSLVIYHAQKQYPYPKDIFSCFEDKDLAVKDLVEPMLLIDLNEMPQDALLYCGGKDTLLKLLLKLSRQKDFIRKIHDLMNAHPEIFVSLSSNQAGFVFEYILHLGKGTPENAKIMKTAISQVYGHKKAEKIFTLADYLRQEGRQEGIKLGEQRGRKEGMQLGKQEGIQLGKQDTISELVERGLISQQIADQLLKENQ